MSALGVQIWEKSESSEPDGRAIEADAEQSHRREWSIGVERTKSVS